MSTFTKPLATSPCVINPKIWEPLPFFGLDLHCEENLLGVNLLLQNRVADASAAALHDFLNDFPCF
jgi:hypothetical protein